MFVQLRKITVTEGSSQKVVDQFSKPGIIEEQEGFVEMKILVKQVRRGEEEVIIMISWKSETYWKQWEKSDAHLAGHKAKKDKPKPEHILNMEVSRYDVAAVKQPAEKKSNA